MSALRTRVIAQAREWAVKTAGTRGERRWKRLLVALGEPVDGAQGLEPLTVAEARSFVSRGWNAWREPWQALAELAEQPAAAPAQPSASAPAMGALTTIHGRGIDELVPDVSAEDWAWVAGSPDDLADLMMRAGHVKAWSREQFERILAHDPHVVADLLHPLQSWGDEEGFLYDLRKWEPMPVPSADGFEAKAVMTAYGPMLMVLFPHRQVVIDENGAINDWLKEGSAGVVDAMQARWPDYGKLEVAWLADGSATWGTLAPTSIPARPRVLLPHYELPGGPGEVRLRVVDFAIDQTNERAVGDWTEPVRITHAHEDAREAWIDEDAAYDFSDAGDSEWWHGGWWLAAQRSADEPSVPL